MKRTRPQATHFRNWTVAELQGGMLTLGTPAEEFDWPVGGVYAGCTAHLQNLSEDAGRVRRGL